MMIQQVVETGDICLSGGYIDLNNGTSGGSTGGPGNSMGGGLGSTAMFQMLGSQVNADVVKKVGAIFQWKITKDGKVAATWSKQWLQLLTLTMSVENAPNTWIELQLSFMSPIQPLT